MKVTWHFAYLMPHTAFSEPIENDFLALVPPGDTRLKNLARQQPAVHKLTSTFADQFQRPINPSALLVRSDAPKSVDFHAVASFRNSIAISSIVDAWCFQMSGGSCGYPLWSDFFDFYPFTATKNGTDLIAQSVVSLEYDKPTKFSGQRAPHLPTGDHLSFGVDRLILDACFKRWHRRFVGQQKEWKTRALFRSLEIAAQGWPNASRRNPLAHDPRRRRGNSPLGKCPGNTEPSENGKGVLADRPRLACRCGMEGRAPKDPEVQS